MSVTTRLADSSDPFDPSGASPEPRTAAQRPRRAVGAPIGVAVATVLTAAVLALGESAARADALETLSALDQGEFLELVENLAAATHYKSLSPAEPLGLLGADLSIGLSSTVIDDESLFERAGGGDHDGDTLLMPRVQVHKGLPFGLDIGAFVANLPEQALTVAGAELRLSLIEGGVATPAVALRGSYSRLLDTDLLAGESAALELSISKGFLMFTPYAGAGIVYSDFEASGVESLEDESFEQDKLYVGLNVNLLSVNVGVEADRTGGHMSYSARLGLRF